MKVHLYILLGEEPKFIKSTYVGKMFFRKSKNAETRYLENVGRKRYRKFEASKRMGRFLKTAHKKRWMEKKKKQQKEDDKILSPK